MNMNGQDPFYEVCDECGRHVVKAGHSLDCSKSDTRTCINGHRHRESGLDSIGMDDACPECGTTAFTD